MNARLDPETATALRRLVGATGLSVTDVLKLSLLRLSEQEARPAQAVVHAFADLIGSFDGPRDLSEGYRHDLAGSMAHKHDAP